MHWLYLLLAGLLEIGFTTTLKLSNGFSLSRPGYILAFTALALASFGMLNKALVGIPLGTAYAVWTGIGAFGTVIVGIVFFGEPQSLWRLVFLSLLIYPLVSGIFLSLFKADLFGGREFVGLENFSRLLRDDVFRQAIANTFYFVVLSVPPLTVLPLLLALLLNRQTRVAAFFRGVGTIPVDRRGGSEAADALSTALRVLQEGRLFGIYPEGTRSPDGRLYRGKTGVARLAVESGAPVYPCALIGTNEIQPTGYRMPRKIMQPVIKLGEPLRYDKDADLREATDEIIKAIQSLSGQEYVDVYASQLKKG